MKRPLVAAVAVLAALSLVPAAGARQAPGAFVAQLYQWALNGQGDRAYNALVPQQRRLISRDTFDRCTAGAASSSAVTITSWKTIDTLRVAITIPGTRVKVPSTVVTVRLAASDGSSSVSTAHLVATKTGWQWMTTNIAKYRAGRC